MVVATNVIPDREQANRSNSKAAARESARTAAELGIGVLFDRLLDAVIVARLSTGRIVLWNRAAEKLFGYTAEEAVGNSIEMLMPDAIVPIHRAGIERYERTGRGLIVDADSPVEMPARTRNGDEIRIELVLSELQSPSGERFALAVLRDAMLRKELELTGLELTQARLARSEAEAALSTRDELLDAVCTALESAPTLHDLQRLTRVLEDLKRVRIGELLPRPVDVDLVDVLYGAADLAGRRARDRRILVHTPPMAPSSCDPALLRQVLDVLLEEIMCDASEGSPIELSVRVLSPQLVQLSLRADLASSAGSGLGVALLVSRTLMQHQGGTLHTELSSSGSLEVIMTAPGSPQLTRRRAGRTRKPARPASAHQA